MKKIVSLLLILCCLAFFIVPVLATEKYDLTDGEMLALHFINEFFASKPEEGIEYDASLNTETKCFVIKAHYPLLESLIIDKPEEYQQMVNHIESLFSSVDSLMRTSVEDSDAYHMTLTFGTSNFPVEYPVAEYLCISSKGGTVHRVNAELVSTSEIKFYVANENAADASTIQATIDFFTEKGATVHGVVCHASQSPNDNGFYLSISGAYCDKFAEGYKGKDAQWVSVPDCYVIDCRKVANDYGLDSIGLVFYNEQNKAFGMFSFQHSSWYGYYYAIDD